MNYVYRFLDQTGNVIYVGKTKRDLEQRFRAHLHLPEACYALTYKIEYIECATESDMSIKEIYYINKYRHDGDFFNVLDMMDAPISVEFSDEWRQYNGPLGPHFHHSINYIQGYISQKEIRYNKDGSVDRRKSNSEFGISTYVDALTADEVDLMVDYLINEINCAENKNQEQIRFRNLVIFILGINIPHKLNDYICLKYQDIFDPNNRFKSIELKLTRIQKDGILNIPLKNVVRKTISAYIQYLGWTYEKNANDVLFQTRESCNVSTKTWWRILNDVATAVGITKNIGVESQRKTYGMNIYSRSENKLNALLFLGEVWGHAREAQVIKYLNLADKNIDFDYYLGEAFSLGNVNLSRIMCLQSRDHKFDVSIPNPKEQEAGEFSSESKHEKKANVWYVNTTTEGARRNKVWSKEIKLEIVNKNLVQHIPQSVLAKEYDAPAGSISQWVNAYRRYGESALEDWRHKSRE